MKSKNTLTFALIAVLSLGFTDKSEAQITLLFSQKAAQIFFCKSG